jgi:hypothetical protein
MTSYVFTSISENYIPKARVLCQTLRRHHPDITAVAVVVERDTASLTNALSIFDEVLSVDSLHIPNFESWIFQHSLVEACTAVKGFALASLLERPETASVMYLDPDIAVFGSLDPLWQALAASDILLTPHLLVPEDEQVWIERNEITALKHGTFNLGFLLVKASAEGRDFAKWWRRRLESYCRAETEEGLFTDQRWVDLVPSFFSTAGIVRDPGCNVATWNIRSRHIAGDFDSGFTAAGHPLRFFHFSGIDSGAQKIMLDLSAPDMPAAHAIRDWYVQSCREQGQTEHRGCWGFGRFSNGEPITGAHRKVYRSSRTLQESYPNPFSTSESNSFWAWYSAHASTAHPSS